jgi:hypothetical protein
MESFIERNISVLKKMELTSNEAVKQALLAGLSSIMLIGRIRMNCKIMNSDNTNQRSSY